MSVVLFAALILQAVDFLKEASHLSTQKSQVLTQLCAWVGGIVLVGIGAHAAVTKAVVLPGTDKALGSLDFWSVVLVGLLASSLASTIADAKQAIDHTDSAAKPPLLDAPAAPTP